MQGTHKGGMTTMDPVKLNFYHCPSSLTMKYKSNVSYENGQLVIENPAGQPSDMSWGCDKGLTIKFLGIESIWRTITLMMKKDVELN